MTIREKILIVEDEKSIAHFISTILTTNGYETILAKTGTEAMTMLSSHCPDLVILDLGLPDMDGIEVLRSLRGWSSLPVVVVSARTNENDKVEALDLGANDYLTKPFRPTVLLMRVKALLRRVDMERGGDPMDRDITVGDLRFSGDEKRLFCREKPLALSPNELKMLIFLMRGEGKAFSRDELLTHIWGYNDEVETRVTDETLRRIRSKLSSADSKVQIETVWGYGYRWNA